MGTITEMKTARGRKGTVTVVIDDGSSFNISKEQIEEAGLHTGLELSPQQVRDLQDRSLYFSCLNAAMHFLAHRARSRKEVAVRLRQRGFPNETIDAVLNRLEENKLINDAEFAREWAENRKTFHPRSKLLIINELKQKGIDRDSINDAVAGLDDEETAYRAGLKKIRTLRSLPPDELSLKLTGYLQSKGFSYSVAEHAAERLWQHLRKDK